MRLAESKGKGTNDGTRSLPAVSIFHYVRIIFEVFLGGILLAQLQATMGSFGENLKREREARGITLEEISRQTKIGVRQLKAIEDEQLDQLPGGIFNKSFVRQYARYLGLDEARVISEYLQAVGPISDAPLGPVNVVSEEKGLSAGGGYLRLIVTAVFVGIALVAVTYGIYQFTEHRASPNASATATSAEPSDASREARNTSTYQPVPGSSAQATTSPYPEQPSGAALPVPSAASSNPTTSTNQELATRTSRSLSAASPVPIAGRELPLGSSGSNAAGPIRQSLPLAATAGAERSREQTPGAEDAGGLALQIDARKEVWLSIAADGQIQWQGTLLADQSRRVQARDSFRLTVGDASAVALTLNGKTLPLLGRPGEVKNLTISSKGLAEPAP